MSETIFRHFKDASGFSDYFSGRWNGIGTHGYVDWPEDAQIKLQIRFRAQGLEVSALRTRRQSFRDKVVSIFRAPFKRLPDAFPDFNLTLEAARFEADLATIASGTHKMVLQAMDDRRCHISLEEQDQKQSRAVLQFSGVLARK